MNIVGLFLIFALALELGVEGASDPCNNGLRTVNLGELARELKTLESELEDELQMSNVTGSTYATLRDCLMVTGISAPYIVEDCCERSEFKSTDACSGFLSALPTAPPPRSRRAATPREQSKADSVHPTTKELEDLQECILSQDANVFQQIQGRGARLCCEEPEFESLCNQAGRESTECEYYIHYKRFESCLRSDKYLYFSRVRSCCHEPAFEEFCGEAANGLEIIG